MAQTIDPEAVGRTAYFLWEAAGRPDGGAEHYWVQALQKHQRTEECDTLLEKEPPLQSGTLLSRPR